MIQPRAHDFYDVLFHQYVFSTRSLFMILARDSIVWLVPKIFFWPSRFHGNHHKTVFSKLKMVWRISCQFCRMYLFRWDQLVVGCWEDWPGYEKDWLSRFIALCSLARQRRHRVSGEYWGLAPPITIVSYLKSSTFILTSSLARFHPAGLCQQPLCEPSALRQIRSVGSGAVNAPFRIRIHTVAWNADLKLPS